MLLAREPTLAFYIMNRINIQNHDMSCQQTRSSFRGFDQAKVRCRVAEKLGEIEAL